jgi:hypothetical protein
MVCVRQCVRVCSSRALVAREDLREKKKNREIYKYTRNTYTLDKYIPVYSRRGSL